MIDKYLLVFEEHLISQGEKKTPNLVANTVNIHENRFSPCTSISIFMEEQADACPCA